jgi:hypothetical protein
MCGLVWFGLVGFSFNASLGPQRRARKRGRLAEAALAHHALWDKAEYPENSRPDPWAGLVWFGLVWFGGLVVPVHCDQLQEEGRADPVREVRLVENIHWGSLGG